MKIVAASHSLRKSCMLLHVWYTHHNFGDPPMLAFCARDTPLGALRTCMQLTLRNTQKKKAPKAVEG